MRMRAAIVSLLLVVTGCARVPADQNRDVLVNVTTKAASPAVAQQAELPPDVVPTNDPARLAGPWHTLPDIAQGEPGDIAVEIGRNRISANSGCVNFDWSYRFTGMRLTLVPRPVVSCQRSLSETESRFSAAMSAATAAYQRGGRGLVFEGAKGRVLLFERAQ